MNQNAVMSVVAAGSVGWLIGGPFGLALGVSVVAGFVLVIGMLL